MDEIKPRKLEPGMAGWPPTMNGSTTVTSFASSFNLECPAPTSGLSVTKRQTMRPE